MESVGRENDEDDEVRYKQREIEGVDMIKTLEAAIRKATNEFSERTLPGLEEQELGQ